MKKLNKMTKEEFLKYVKKLRERLRTAHKDVEWFKAAAQSAQAEADELKKSM